MRKRPVEDIDEIIIHCSASQDKDIGYDEIKHLHTAPKTEEIQWGKYKTHGKAWSDIGYHFVIRRNGDIENGRDLDRMGAHAPKHNYNSIGICMVGEDNNFTEPQWTSLKYLVHDLLDTHQKIGENVKGHCDVDKRKPHCPGFKVKDWFHTNVMHGDQFF